MNDEQNEILNNHIETIKYIINDNDYFANDLTNDIVENFEEEQFSIVVYALSVEFLDSLIARLRKEVKEREYEELDDEE